MPQTSDLIQGDRIRGRLRQAVPCLDAAELRSPDSATIATVRNACLETGFFFLDRNFDERGAVPRTLERMEAFFSLADDDPRKLAVEVSRTGSAQGWTPLFGELPYQPGTVAHVESFDCKRPASPDARAALPWPDLPDFRDDIDACWELLAYTGRAVLGALSLAAGLERDFLANRCESQAMNTLRLLHYPPREAPPTAADVGISAHTDFECMTLIMQTAPGLELLAADGSWYDVPGHDGRLVVMLDDMLERWTNGLFRATGHRVRATGERRYSIVMFFAVDDDQVIAPLPAFVSADNPARYSPVRQREHLQSELEKAARNREEPS